MDLYIIGAGDVGGFIAYHINQFTNLELKGFIDDDLSKHHQNFHEIEVVGDTDYLLNIQTEIAVALAIANPTVKKNVVQKLKRNHLIHFPSFVHPKAWIGSNVVIDEGCIIYPGTCVNYETDIPSFSTINMNCAIGHNCQLGPYTTLSPGVNLGGGTKIGQCSFVGIGVSTLQGITIGEYVTVGGMTMVLKNIPNGVTVVGNPGRIIKTK